MRAEPGTLIHPKLDKVITKWVAMKDLGAFGPGLCAESEPQTHWMGPGVHISTDLSTSLSRTFEKECIVFWAEYNAVDTATGGRTALGSSKNQLVGLESQIKDPRGPKGAPVAHRM